ncbi:peptidoglycan-binding protein [Streptosporangium carneum]|uniref:Peptidoglycan-binding protein n=1 Tax=Streptosporangium carneum TaxID=47481 RepID=A0A9W6I9Q6_9ACTN|nr:peptidoglycan-binding protein [Streptosporangium carneum]
MVGVVAVAVGGGAAAAVLNAGPATPGGGPATPQTGVTAPAKATAGITRSDLVDTRRFGGTLGYSGRRVQPNRARGVVTGTRPEGTVVRRGGWLYKVARRPVVLMYGSIPMYRSLAPGSGGGDVGQLERNLVALGYDPGTVDDDFTWATARAVRRWQGDSGLTRTGSVDAGQVVVASGPLRIAGNTAEKGDTAGRTVVTTTSTRRTVHIDLQTAYQRFARVGAKVTVELPDGRTVRGRISSVGVTARVGADRDSPATIDVDATVAGGLGRLDQAPVTVDLRTERRENVLSVPVEALVALREGGYGVRVVDGSATRVVAVRTGLYAVSRVEITGDGLTEGMKVEVPRT